MRNVASPVRSRRYAPTVCSERCRSWRRCATNASISRASEAGSSSWEVTGSFRSGRGRVDAHPLYQRPETPFKHLTRGLCPPRACVRIARRCSGPDREAPVGSARPRHRESESETFARDRVGQAMARRANVQTRRSSSGSSMGGSGCSSSLASGHPEVVQQVVGAADHGGTLADQRERHLGERARDRSGHREHLAPQIEGMIDRDPRAARRRPLHHDERGRQRDDDAVASGEPVRLGRARPARTRSRPIPSPRSVR